MSAFVDSGVFFGAYSEKDEYHDQAVNLLEKALQGEYGAVYTSDYIFDETVTLARVRAKSIKTALLVGESILGSRIRLLQVNGDIFDKAWNIFKQYEDKNFSFTDCTSIALIRELQIDTMLSFDDRFDGIVSRVKWCQENEWWRP